jgi:hypothetical protein
MSHAAVINYQSLSIECKAICSVTENTLANIDELLNHIHETSKTVTSTKIDEYRSYLIKEREFIASQIENLRSKADEQAKLGSRVVASNEQMRHRNDLINAASSLKSAASNISISKIEVLKKLIDEEIINVSAQTRNALLNARDDRNKIGEVNLKKIELIEDVSLREMAFRTACDDAYQGNSFEEIMKFSLERLSSLKSNLLLEHQEKLKAKIRVSMEKAKVDQDTIDKTLASSTDLEVLQTKADQEIIGEHVRKESLKIIIKAIETRGFIVDRKNNIKIDKDLNIVNVVAKKASGQTAQFKIYLDGRFYYKFDGFEGQACQEDIEPFMSDLENIYGMKITGKQDIWSNPDKLSTQKYQTYDKNKGKK